MNYKLRLFIFLIVAVSLTAAVVGQQKKPRQKNLQIINSELIVADKPSVYMTVVGFGKRKPVYTGESDEGIWLRLHNNTRWPLVLDAHGVDGKATPTDVEEEVGMFYGVEKVPAPEFTGRVWPPIDYSRPQPGPDPSPAPADASEAANQPERCSGPYAHWCHVCSIIELPPGKSLLFSMPRENLCKQQMIFLRFKYAWETSGQEPEHRVYFYATQLSR